MAAVVGRATGAVMAAIVKIFEMPLDYNVMIPVPLTVALSFGMRKILCEEKTRRGHRIAETLRRHFYHAGRMNISKHRATVFCSLSIWRVCINSRKSRR